MSAREALVAAVAARLRATAALAAVSVFDAAPVRAALPYLTVEEPMLADRSATGWTGREGRLTISLYDGGERPVRLRALAEAAEAATLSLPADLDPELGGGWRVVALTLARSRMVRSGDRWLATSEFQVRMWRAG